MNENVERLVNFFKRVLQLEDEESVESAAYQQTDSWDSLAHMALISELERVFEVTLEMDDVIDLSSYSESKMILKKYGISFEK